MHRIYTRIILCIMYILLRRPCVRVYESSVLFARRRNPVMEYIRLCARRIIRLLLA